MNCISSLVLALFLPVQETTAALPIVSNPHKYFAQKLLEEVDKADTISPIAVPYAENYPTIDISPWIDPPSSTDDERLHVVHQVLEQAIGAGSFNIIGHNVSIDMLGQLESSTEKFFSQSIDLKKRYSSKKPGTGGYTANQEHNFGPILYKKDEPFQPEGDLRETYSMAYPPARPENVQGPEYFQSALDEYIEQLQPVDTALTKIFSAALGIAKGIDIPLTFLDEAGGEAAGFFTAQRYPSMPKEYDNATKLVPHSDFGTLTIIYGTEEGLEEIRDGRWVEVPISEERGELHVSVGQMLNMWSNGLFADNVHRVSKLAVDDRVSFAYFLAQGPESVPVDGIEPICAEGEKAKFPLTSTALHVSKYITAMLEQSKAV